MKRAIKLDERLKRRVQVAPAEYERIMETKKQEYGKVLGKIDCGLLEDGTFYLAEVDDKLRRKYEIKSPSNSLKISKTYISADESSKVAMNRVEKLNLQMATNIDGYSGFYKIPIADRIKILKKNISK